MAKTVDDFHSDLSYINIDPNHMIGMHLVKMCTVVFMLGCGNTDIL